MIYYFQFYREHGHQRRWSYLVHWPCLGCSKSNMGPDDWAHITLTPVSGAIGASQKYNAVEKFRFSLQLLCINKLKLSSFLFFLTCPVQQLRHEVWDSREPSAVIYQKAPSGWEEEKRNLWKTRGEENTKITFTTAITTFIFSRFIRHNMKYLKYFCWLFCCLAGGSWKLKCLVFDIWFTMSWDNLDKKC